MPRNGNGDFSLVPGNPVVPGTVIESEWANNTMNDIAAALTDSIAADGQTTPLANLPMGGFHHTGVSDPTLRNQYATLGMSQDGRNTRIQITGGVNNLTGTLVGGATAYSAGAVLSFFAPANNTGTMTMSYNGIAAASIVTSQGLPLQAGDIVSGKNYLLQYTGSTFQLLSPVTSQAGNIYTQAAVTGQRRPESGVFPTLTLASGTSINVPAGQGVIVPPGSDGANDAFAVSWSASSVTLTYLSTSFSTTIAIDSSGNVAQFAGRIPSANERDYIVLGFVVHVNGVATSVVTSPAIFGDNGYLAVDSANVLTNMLIAGGETTPVGATLQLAVANGLISSPGGNSTSINSPNTVNLVGGSPISFRTLAGQGTVGAVITNAPVSNYDPNGSGVVTALPANGDATIHRLYYLYGEFIWVYGQRVYTSVSNALNYLEVDRSKYQPSLRLSDATLIAEVISTKTNTDLSGANAAIVVYGGAYFSIGSSGGISDAPVDGQSYGRRNATWSPVVGAANPSVTGDLTITDGTPVVREVMSPVTAGYLGLNTKQLGFDWCNIEVTHPDDKVYFRSYNPADGVLRNTTTWDLATGNWTIPNLTPQSSALDQTSGRLLTVGAFGWNGGVVIEETVNCNNLTIPGMYNVTTAAANRPSTEAVGYFVRTSRRANNSILQEAVLNSLATTPTVPIYSVRTLFSDGLTWSPWFSTWDTANLVLTTSNIDATAGRVTKVGDGGILNTGNAPVIVSLDTTASMPSGLMRYSAGVTLGTPPTGAAANGSVLIERFSGTIIKQTWTDVVGNSTIAPRTWVRTSSTLNTWGPWSEVARQDTTPYFQNTTGRHINSGTVAGGTITVNPVTTAEYLIWFTSPGTVAFDTSALPQNQSCVCSINAIGSAITWPAGIFWPNGAIPTQSGMCYYTFNFRRMADNQVQINGFQSGRNIAGV